MAQRNARTSFWHKKCKGLSSKQQPIVAPDPSRVQSNHINRDSGGDDARKRRVIGVVEEEKIEILRFCAIGYCRQPYLMQELAKEFRAAGLEAVESDINSEAKVSTSKIVQPLEVHEVGDTSRMEERLSDASMEGTVVPNTVSPEVDLTKQLDRMWEGNMMEDLRVLEVSSLSRNWSNEEETCIVNRMDSSPSDAAGLKEVFIQENGIQEGIGDIVSLGGLFDVSSRIE
ncbi:hypothetical protein V6N13_047383 [Hibiscus sabdariffa]